MKVQGSTRRQGCSLGNSWLFLGIYSQESQRRRIHLLSTSWISDPTQETTLISPRCVPDWEDLRSGESAAAPSRGTPGLFFRATGCSICCQRRMCKNQELLSKARHMLLLNTVVALLQPLSSQMRTVSLHFCGASSDHSLFCGLTKDLQSFWSQ